MSKLIRRTVGSKKRGTALIVALQLTALTFLSLVSFVSGPKQQSSAGGTPAVSQPNAAEQAASDTDALQNQTQSAQAPTAIDRSELRASAVYANKVYGPRASQIFNLAASRAAAAQNPQHTQSTQGPESPDEEPTLTTDQEDYPPYSYVYLHGTGFQPGETVSMIVVETDPIQQSFEPWDVVADESGEIDTSWYIFSSDFIGATLQATATGESSQLTASATFTDASGDGIMTVSPASALPGSTGNSFTFSFRNGGNAFTSGSIATVVVPAGWTAPQSASSGLPGFVTATAVGTATVTNPPTVTGSGPWTITVPFTSNPNNTNGFNLSYGGGGTQVTAPSTTGAYTFTTSTRLGASGTPVPLASSPVIFSGISAALAAPSFGDKAANLTTIASTSVTATSGQTLLILVTAANDSGNVARPITSVANTTGANPLQAPATLITTNAAANASWYCNGSDCFYMYAFRATATGTAGTVTATFTTAVRNAVIDVIKLSGNNTTTPIGVIGINSQTSPPNSSPNWVLSGTPSLASSMLLFGDLSNGTNAPPTWSTSSPAGFTQLDSFPETENGSNQTRSHRSVNYFGGPSATSVTGSIAATPTPLPAWGTIAIEILPATTPTPTCTPPLVTAQPAPQTVTYGTASVMFTAAASGSPAPTVQWQVSTNGGSSFSDLSNGGNISGATTGILTISNPTVATPALQYRAVFTNTCNGTQTATSNAATLTVNPKGLDITASDQSKTYGTAFTFAGTEFATGAGQLVSGDSVTSVTLTSTGAAATATVVAPGPTYDITPSAAVGTGLGNYTIAYHVGHFTVNSKGLDITANDRTKTYGDTVTFAGTEFGTGAGQLVNGDSVTSVTLTSTGAVATATVVAPGPTYAITASAATGTGLGNYTIAYHNGTLTVSQKAATWSTQDNSKTYGADDPMPLTIGSGSGFLAADNATATYGRVSGETVANSPYHITATLSPTGVLGNYNITNDGANFTIQPKAASVTADNKSKQYGDDNPALTATVTGTVNGDTLNYSLATTAVKFSSVGDYPITVTLGSNPNYTVTPTSGTLHINPKAATVTADNKSKQYGDDNPVLTATVTGTVNGDTLNYSLATTAVKFSSVGDYPITVTVGSNPNYTVTPTNGTLHIDPKTATVAADNKSKAYGQANPTLTATVTGTVNGDTLNYTLATTALQFSNVGGYPITVTLGSNPNYSVTKTDGTLTINQAVATVTADNKSKTYGQANPTLTATVTGEVTGGDSVNYTLATTALQFSNVGGYPITVTLGSNPNYSVTKTDGTLTINQAVATVTADAKSKTYGQLNPTLTATVTGEVTGGDSVNYTLATTALQFSNVGGYPITVTLGSNPNYSVTKTDGTLTINQAVATVTADSKSKTYGQLNPTLTATVTGEVTGGDSVNYTLATTALQFSNVGGYPITVTLGSNPNYSVTKTDGTLTINQAVATVTADSKSKTYGQLNPTLTATVTGEVTGGDAVNYTLATTALQFSNVGGYPITVTLGSNPNYSVTKTDGTLTINQAVATVTADAKSKTYGQLNPTLTATVVGEVTGGDPVNYTLATTAAQFSNVGGYPITVTLGSNPNYSVTKTDGTLTINQAVATVTADVKSKTYGQLNPTLTATVVGEVTGGDAVNYTLATTALQFSNVGGYPITVTLGSNPNYSVTKTDGTLTINQAVATVTADAKSKTYGQLNPTLTATVTGEVTGGDPVNYTLATTAAQFSNVGGYPITVTLGSNPNYSVTKTDGTLTINQAVATVTADNKMKTYGQANPTLTATVVGEVTGGDAVNYTLATTAAQFSNVGGYPITVTLGSNPNYSVTKTDGTLTINQAVATVTANDKMKTYGDANPTLTATVSGEVTGGDPVNYTLATTAAQFSNVGGYPITVTLGSNPNYSVTKTDGTLTIDQANATVTADNKMKIYGQANPTLTAVVTGEVTGGDSINYTLSTTTLQFSNVGPYAITVNLGSNPNYNITVTDGTLTINQANATVTADNKMKTYGQANPTLTAVVAGEVAGGDSVNYTLATTAAQFSNVGPYAITVNLGSNPNYNITVTNGTLTINQANATVTADAKSKTYGQLNPGLTATVVGQVTGGDPVNYTLATTATQFSNVGGYPITVTLGSNPNYSVTKTDGTLTINQAVATVTADAKSKTYGQLNPGLTATVVGQVTGGDPVNYTLATTATQFSNVGGYPITVTLGSNPNYSVTKTDGTLTINQAVATVTADAKSKTYGQLNPGLTATVVGQVTGGDPVNYTLATTATQFSNVGPYAITVTLGSNPNYSVTKTDGTLTINQAIATVTADSKTKAYLAPNPTLTATVVGQVTGGDPINYTLSTTATPTSVPGTYAIAVTLGSNPNYSMTKTDGMLSIGYGTCTGPNGPGGVILQPINADGTSVVKQGSTVPVKFTICDANGNPISDPMAVFGTSNGSITLISAVRGTVDNVNEAADNDIPDVAFRYSSGIWIFNMATNNLTKNTTYTYHINLKVGTINFTFGTK